MAYLGNAWLRQHFELSGMDLAKECRLGSRPKKVPGTVEWEYFPKQYAPEETPLAQVEFALKYDFLHLELLSEVFARIPLAEVRDWVARQPTGKWARRVGYLYEFLTGADLQPQSLGVGGNYAPLLDAEAYEVAARPEKVPRWRIEDNLLGDRDFCPVVRRTEATEKVRALDVGARLDTLKGQYPPEVFRRATGYLYQKETRTSFEIEREAPTPDREASFVAALQDAGTVAAAQAMSETRLVALQRVILDARYAQTTWRDYQNYVGGILPNYQEKVHFIPPPPQFVPSLMAGLGHFIAKSEGCHPVCRAAVAAFGFVFVHPFEDGNGRLHRFLIHDVLAMDRYVPPGVVFPVSAWILKHMPDYDQCLEHFSRPLMDRARYTLDVDAEHALTVTNPEAIERVYRYPDMTAQVEFLGQAIVGALEEELEPELRFLHGYDRARSAMRRVVDMPDRKLDTLIKILRQNNGRMSASKRGLYAEISDAEMARLVAAWHEGFAEPQDG